MGGRPTGSHLANTALAVLANMTSLITGTNSTSPSTLVANFTAPVSSLGAGAWAPVATESRRQCVIGAGHTIKNFWVKIAVAPGTAKQYTFGINVNGTDQLTIVISGNSATSGTATGSVAIVAGDLVCLSATPSGTPGGIGQVSWGWDQVANSPYSYNFMSAHTVTTGATLYGVPTAQSTANATEANGTGIVPCAGTLQNLYIRSADAPTVGTIVVTLRIQGTTDTTLTATIPQGGTAVVSDTTHTVAVSAGDKITWKIVTGTVATTVVFIGCEFAPTASGDFFLCANDTSAGPSTSATNYEALGAGSASWNATVGNRQQGWPLAATVKAIYGSLVSAPGAAASGKKFVFAVNIGGSDSAATLTISETATTGNSGAVSVALAQGNLIAISSVPTSTPTASNAAFGIKLSIP